MLSRICRLSAAVMLVGGLFSQTSDTTLRVTSRLVQISVIAKDHNGNPVGGLTRDDFVLADNKQPQRIAVFSVDATGPDKSSFPIVKTGPLTIANRALHPDAEPTAVTVIVFDALNIDRLDDFQYGRRALIEFLKTLHAGDPVAIYSINGPQVRVAHDFTDDASSLIEAAKRLSGTNKPTGGNLVQLGTFLKEASSADEAARRHLTAEWTLTALEAIARHLNGVPGRKNMVWISNGFPMNLGLNIAFMSGGKPGVNQDLLDYSLRVNRIARILADANVAVYPIDPAGVRTDPAKSEQSETMRSIAQRTGGLAFFNNDVARNIRRASDDARITYTLGFYPAPQSWDGNFHNLQVSVKRPGVQARARSGYFAASLAELEPEREEALKLAVASPLEGVALGIKVNVESNPLRLYGQQMALEIDPRDLLFELDQGRMRANVDAVFAQLSRDGRLVRGERKTIYFNLSPKSYQDALTTGLFLSEPVTVERNTSRVRVVVQDGSTAAVGSVSIPVRASGLN